MDQSDSSLSTVDTQVVDALLPLYWRYVPQEELSGRLDTELSAAVVSHAQLAAVRVPGELKLRVGTPADAAFSVIEVVTDDMPFLVDSVTAELARLNVTIRLFVHPQPVVLRDGNGQLLAVRGDVDTEEAQGKEVAESWMRIEVDRLGDGLAERKVYDNLVRVLSDVRAAVEDWDPMRATALRIADELALAELPVPDKDVADSRELLRWLVDDHFTFLGYREYRLVHDGDGDYLSAVPGTGLGILRGDESEPRSIKQMPPEVRAHVMKPRLLIITKANSRATVHHPSFMDYIGFKVFDANGVVIGERRFLGLFSSTAYFESVRKLPVVSRKVEEVIEQSGLSLRSHSGRDLLQTLEMYPRDELFQIRTGELYQTMMEVLRLTGRRDLRLFVRKDLYGRFVSCMVYLPRDRYTTRTRFKMQDILTDALHGIGVDYTARVSENMQARVRFIVRVNPENEIGEIDVAALQARLAEATRMWEDDFVQELEKTVPPARARDLGSRYGLAFSEGYRAERSPKTAVADIEVLETLTEPGAIAVRLDGGKSRGDDALRFTIYHHGDQMPLSQVLPVLQSLGVRVLDERPYHVTMKNGSVLSIYDYGLTLAPGQERAMNVGELAGLFEDAFVACWRGEAEVDGLNSLVFGAGFSWEQVLVLRAYARYLRQAGTRYSQGYIERALNAHTAIARDLVQLFDARFNPAPAPGVDPQKRAGELVAGIEAALEDVSSLDEDRIVRWFLSAFMATLRTNYYQRTEQGGRKNYLSLKLNPLAIDGLPLPRPKFEIFVYSPRMEGVHMRFGSVARGGLRWSDRKEDFRTEVLGLVKAQMVKNAIIVPTGSKGGFVVKHPPVGGDRAALQAEGIACYKMFICGLLDITDNLVDGKVEPPANVVRTDGDDTYLVVAADKGTATFSDIANEIARSYGFWLGDAFASGGSAGYDHKKMGITARGAWESVKRHFREMGINTQEQDFTVVGIGDMSGDVFGNGMLLSQHIRLVAAFDHRHIFIDPTPDAARSFVERQRLFDLPSSSWDSYDKSLISQGGGVWPRTAKSIPLTPEAKAALGIAEDVRELSPADLISVILRAPVDLLWNGGIGTYVKASSETHSDAGDKSNDTVRINGNELRCKVVGEGGNLGLTQLGRIEYALRGGRINTDAIDNSAGVDTSDHEVNIKILLGSVGGQELSLQQRNETLVHMTDEIAALVLRNNYDQNVALMTATHLAPKLFSVHRRLLSELERTAGLNRAIEFLPNDEECAEREAAGKGLTEPELSVLLAYVKIKLKEAILASALPDDPWCLHLLVDYFPTPLREKYRAQMESHPLRREIISTVITNEVVDAGGITFVHRAMEETGASAVDVARAYLVTRQVFNLASLWNQNEALDNVVDTRAQVEVEAKLRRVIDRGVRWLLQARGGTIDVKGEIDRLRPGLTTLLPRVPRLSLAQEKESLQRTIEMLKGMGVPDKLATETLVAQHGFGLFDVVELATARDLDPEHVAEVYYTVRARFHVEELFDSITSLPRHDRWTALARMAVRYDLYAVLAGITAEVLDGETGGRMEPGELVDRWVNANQVRIERVERTLAMLPADAKLDLATVSVLLRQMRAMVPGS